VKIIGNPMIRVASARTNPVSLRKRQHRTLLNSRRRQKISNPLTPNAPIRRHRYRVTLSVFFSFKICFQVPFWGFGT
jgi:hypothetical protein